MVSHQDAPSLLETARDQMQQLFKARTPPKAANEACDGHASSAPERLDLSPRASLKVRYIIKGVVAKIGVHSPER